MSLEAIGLPPQLWRLIEQQALPKYRAEVKKHEAWLEARGEALTQAAIAAMLTRRPLRVKEAKPKPGQPPAPPKPDVIVTSLLEPVIDPLAKGVKKGLRPFAIGAVTILVAWSAGMVFAGRWSKRCMRTS